MVKGGEWDRPRASLSPRHPITAAFQERFVGGSFLKFFWKARVCEYVCFLREFVCSNSCSSSSRAGLPVSAVDSAVDAPESGRVVRAKWVYETSGSRPSAE